MLLITNILLGFVIFFLILILGNLVAIDRKLGLKREYKGMLELYNTLTRSNKKKKEEKSGIVL